MVKNLMEKKIHPLSCNIFHYFQLWYACVLLERHTVLNINITNVVSKLNVSLRLSNMFLTSRKQYWTILKMSSLLKGSSAHIVKDQELNIKDIAKRSQEDTPFYIVSHVHCITGNSLPRPKK